ncbi:MAG: DUF2273 domain-containing protein [Firmicutes bacterium]|nr:DUF2273 domain-containing protein [Bacillota bacterium]
MNWEKLGEILMVHRGKIVGGLIGLILGWLTLQFGLWRALLVCLFVMAGLWAGSLLDREGWDRLYERVVGRKR